MGNACLSPLDAVAVSKLDKTKAKADRKDSKSNTNSNATSNPSDSLALETPRSKDGWLTQSEYESQQIEIICRRIDRGHQCFVIRGELDEGTLVFEKQLATFRYLRSTQRANPIGQICRYPV